jgi:Ca2+-binding EF-hand superfamily protein
MDTNKDGVVSKEQLKSLLQGLGDDIGNIDDMILIADENGDGKIQFEEFIKAVTEGNF